MNELDWRFQIRRIHLDGQGYDDNGVYFGTGQKLWEVTRAGTQASGLGKGFRFTDTVRATSLADAVYITKNVDRRYRYVRAV